jgi:serine/threonine-protein kinase
VGAWDEAISEFEAATALDPLNTEIAWALGQTWMQVGEYDLAQQVFERTLRIDPTMWAAEFEHAFAALLRDGDTEPISGVVSQASNEFPNVQTFTRWWLAYVEGDEERAFNVSAALTGPIEQQANVHPAALLNALMHDALGRRERAAAAADTALAVLLPLLQSRPDDPRVHAAIGTAHALQDRQGEALEAVNEAVRLLPVERDALDGTAYMLHLARVHALLGNTDAAAAAVQELVPLPKRTSLPHILLEPAFSALRGHPDLS